MPRSTRSPRARGGRSTGCDIRSDFFMSKLALFGGPRAVPRPRPQARLCPEYPLAERFAEYVGAAHGLLVGSGTAALVSALLGVGVGPGDEVITVAHSWFCTATSILQVNAVPVFVDVDA